MSTVGFATLDVIPSVRGLRAELEKQTGGDLSRAGAVGGKRYGDAAGKEAAGRFKGHLTTATDDLKRMLTSPLAGAAIGTGIVLGFKSVVGAASEAEQAVGGVRAVFGQYANDVIADSQRASQGLGLSATAYQELITLSGALLKNKGIEDFAAQGEVLIKVGADLAAQFGGSTREAVEALNSAMRGESDPIERYAISLNETAINAELARTGMDGLKGSALDQAKTQARLSLIQQQSADAAGAFGRESDTAAGAAARATAQFANMRQELGEKLLPATSAFIGFLNDDALPALSTAGGVAQDVGSAIGGLPTPVKAAAAAFVALRLASATGLNAGIASSASSARGAIDSLRIRTMLAADAFTNTRTVTRQFADTTARVSSGVGRATASLNALRAGATGAGAALRTGIGGAVGMLGGPWGIALIAGTALLAKFWGEQQEAKAHVEELTDSLDAQTGAITENTRATVIDKLEKEGILKTAQELGLSMVTVTDAALGNASAMEELRAAEQAAREEAARHIDLEDGNNSYNQRVGGLERVVDALGGEASALGESREAARRKAAADSGSAATTEDLTGKIRTYATELDTARSALQKLIDKEKERALNAIQNRRDSIALRETLKVAREEAAAGKQTLNENTNAGRENMSALLDLADQWANSTPKVQNARGAYEEIRNEFIELADQMNGPGGTRADAKALADELLQIPKNVGPKFQSEGYRELLAEIAAIKAAASNLGPVGIDFTPRGFGTPPAPLPGGNAPQPSTDTSGDGSRGIDPRPGVTFTGPVTIQPHDYNDFERQAQRKGQRAGLGGRPR